MENNGIPNNKLMQEIEQEEKTETAIKYNIQQMEYLIKQTEGILEIMKQNLKKIKNR